MADAKKDLYLKKLGQRIADFRKSKGWKQKDLGDIIGWKDRQTISRIENGHHDPGSYTLLLIAEAFGMTYSEFVDFDSKDN